MLNFIQTDPSNTDYLNLVKLLDTDLAKRDGDEHAFYAQYNKSDHIKHVVVAYDNNLAVGCGAIKKFTDQSVEVKRMYVAADERGKGIASLLLNELEKWAHHLGYEYCVLETGTRQPEAIALYKKNGYDIIPNYGPYEGVENSVCFQKTLRPDP